MWPLAEVHGDAVDVTFVLLFLFLKKEKKKEKRNIERIIMRKCSSNSFTRFYLPSLMLNEDVRALLGICACKLPLTAHLYYRQLH